MTIVLAGKSPKKARVEEILRSEGFECVTAASPRDAKELSRDFPVILLGNSAVDLFLSDDVFAFRKISGLGAGEPAVFLLDYGSDTPDYVLPLVLRRAVSTALSKRPVFILARSVRSGIPGVEKLYFDARNAGAAIIKYEELSIQRSDDICEISVSDGIYRYTLGTPLLVDCAIEEDKEAIEYAKALRIHTYGSNRINEDRWFLSPGRTSRRGVYFLDTGLIVSDRLKDTIFSIADELRRSPDAQQETRAHVDASKCAFCYTCFRVCPHAALEPDGSAAAMKVIQPLCTGCGICAAVCPAKAIGLHGIGHIGIEPGSAGKTLAFCCENSAAIAADTAFRDIDADIVRIPCGGSLDGESIAAALKTYSRVIVAVCADEACRHFDGSVRSMKQVEKIKQAVGKLGVDPGRIGFVRVSHAAPAVLRDAAGR